MPTKRLRIFAGPNGSGKSTIEDLISSKYNLGQVINADKIESVLRGRGQLSFNTYGITVNNSELKKSIAISGFNKKANLLELSANLTVSKNVLKLKSKDVPYAYLGAILSELIRNKSLDENRTFSFETVMSHPSKLDFIREAKVKGFKTYLYFVCTESVNLNISRVQNRVQLGGHSVPTDKIKSRYTKSLILLADAVKLADRAFILDNSQQNTIILLAEKYDGEVRLLESNVPPWFDKYFVKKLS